MYTEHFGLSEQPFQLTPDARFWFESRTHRKAMAYLGFGLAQSEGFIVITGEVGAGKSTLVAHLMANIDRARLNAVNLVSTQVEGDDMLRLAAQGLGLSTSGVEKARLLEGVERRLREVSNSGQRTLLIVDEAQNLPVSALEELRMLSNFQIGGKALIQILLLGQPEFRDRLQAPGLEQLRQRVIASHHLDPMGDDEVEAYLGHRLQLVGWTGQPDFAADAITALHRHSGGIPRKVNQLANRLMVHAAIENILLLDGAAVDRIADEIGTDSGPVAASAPPSPPKSVRERLAQTELGSAVSVAPASPSVQPLIADPALVRRIARLEAQVAEQEASLKRVLTLMIDWVETGNHNPSYRSHAA